MGFWRPAAFGRGVIGRVIRPVSIWLVIVLVIVGLIIDIVAISVRTAGIRMAGIWTVTVDTVIIGPVTVRTIIIGSISIGTVAIALSIQSVVVSTVIRPVIIGSFRIIIRFNVIERRRAVAIITTIWPLLQNGADWFVLSEGDCDPAVVVVNAGPLSGVQSSGVYVHQGLFVGDHLVQLLQLPLLPCQLIVHDSSTPRRSCFPGLLATFFPLPAVFPPLPARSVLALLSAPAPAAAPAVTPATTPTPTATPASLMRPISASATPVPAALTITITVAVTVTVTAVAAFPTDVAAKLVSRWTPAPTSRPTLAPAATPAPAVAISTPTSTATPSASALAVLRSQIFHHRLQLVCLWFVLALL